MHEKEHIGLFKGPSIPVPHLQHQLLADLDGEA